MFKPVFTEKSLKMARRGVYTFWVDSLATKPSLKAQIAKLFGVTVLQVKTVKKSGEKGKNARGRKFVDLSSKKAFFTLKGDEKIDLFEEGKK